MKRLLTLLLLGLIALQSVTAVAALHPLLFHSHDTSDGLHLHSDLLELEASAGESSDAAPAGDCQHCCFGHASHVSSAVSVSASANPQSVSPYCSVLPPDVVASLYRPPIA